MLNTISYGCIRSIVPIIAASTKGAISGSKPVTVNVYPFKSPKAVPVDVEAETSKPFLRPNTK